MTERSIFHRIEWQVNVTYLVGLVIVAYLVWRFDLSKLLSSRNSNSGEGGLSDEAEEIFIE